MQQVYVGATALEAHMILNLLQQNGIEGRIEGEYLQGAVGGVQAVDVVRVVVTDADYPAARQVVSDWDAMQVQPEPDRPVTTTKRRGMLKFAVLLLVVAGGYWVYHLPLTSNDADYNADGVADDKWFYNHDQLVRMEQDRNRDGKRDAIHYYDAGLVDYTELDDNFDGVFESRIEYENNLLSYQRSDLDGDGQTDYQAYFRYGILERIVISGKNSAGKTARKQQVFQGNKLVSARYDADGDGFFEKQYKYDFFEEPAP